MPLRVDRKLPLAMFALLLIGAGKPQPDALPTVGPAADYPVVVGEPFVIEGTTYTPADRLNFDQVGQAMQGSDGGDAISIAHKTLPLPSYAEITALDTGRTILVRVERRGPMRNDRLVELSPGAAAQLGVPGQMQVPIRIRRVNPPEVERAMLRRGERVAERMDTPPGLLVVLRRKLDPQAAAGTLPGAAPAPPPAPIAAPAPKPPVVARNGSPAATVSPAPVVSAKPVPKPVPAAKPAHCACTKTRDAAQGCSRPACKTGGEVSTCACCDQG